MSDTSSAAAVATAVAIEHSGTWRDFFARLLGPCAAFFQRWSEQPQILSVHDLTEAELLDMGASRELIDESHALREFEHARACAMCHYYW